MNIQLKELGTKEVIRAFQLGAAELSKDYPTTCLIVDDDVVAIFRFSSAKETLKLLQSESFERMLQAIREIQPLKFGS
jgi:hypothetical protein